MSTMALRASAGWRERSRAARRGSRPSRPINCRERAQRPRAEAGTSSGEARSKIVKVPVPNTASPNFTTLCSCGTTPIIGSTSAVRTALQRVGGHLARRVIGRHARIGIAPPCCSSRRPPASRSGWHVKRSRPCSRSRLRPRSSARRSRWRRRRLPLRRWSPWFRPSRLHRRSGRRRVARWRRRRSGLRRRSRQVGPSPSGNRGARRYPPRHRRRSRPGNLRRRRKRR